MVDDAIAHFCRVNCVSLNEIETHKDDAFDLWARRNALRWTVDWGAFAAQVAAVAEKRAARAAASASVDAPARPRLPVKPDPGRKTPTPEEHVADMLRRFPKTMAYLAEH